LTFNTTSLPLERVLRRKLLLVREPLRPLGDQKRFVLVTPQIDALFDGHIEYGLFPDVSAETLVGIFSAGYLVTVSRKFTKKKPDLEQVVGYDEVWAVCPRKPQPGWRLLGRFYDQDIFVALRAWEKGKLFGSYPQAAQEIIQDWNELFGAQEPHRGQDVGDYLSGVFRDVDQI
jgi:hypothetical protein